MKWHLALGFVVALGARSHAAEARTEGSWPPPAAVSYALGNGLDVVLAEDHRLPIVGMTIQYGSGTGNDRGGLSLYLPRLMLRASGHVPRGDYARLLEEAGARTDWSLYLDGTTFDLTLPATRANLALWLWSDQLATFGDRVDDALVGEVAGIVKAEQLKRVDGVPYGSLEELVRQNLYPDDHPYRTAPRSVPAGPPPSAADVRAYFMRNFGPDNATLVVAGDFDPATMRAEIAKYFGPIKSRGIATRTVAAGGTPRETRLLVKANVDRTLVSVDWLVDGTRRDLDVLAATLGGAEVRALEWRLVHELKVATRALARFEPRALGSVLEITIDVAAGHTPDEVVTALDETLAPDKLGSGSFDVAVRRASANLAGALRRRNETLILRTHAMAREGTLDPIGDAEGLASVERDDVLALSAKLSGKSRVITVFRPDPSAPAAGEVVSKTRTDRGTP